MHMLFRWLVLTVAVWVAAAIFYPSVRYDRTQDLLIAALVLGILNTLVRPILRLLSLPFIIVTFGLFLIVINALLLRLTGRLVPGFHVDGFWPAVGGSLVISLISLVLGYSRRRDPPSRSHGGWRGPFRHARTRHGPPPGKGPIIDV